MYLILQNLDLRLLVVDLVALFPHSLKQLHDALLLAVDHILVMEKVGIMGSVKQWCYLIVNIHNTLSQYYSSHTLDEQMQNNA